MRLTKLGATVVAAGLAIVPSASAQVQQNVPAPAPTTGVQAKGVQAKLSPAEGPIVQMFGWPWDSLARECRSSLGPSGYAAIQVSPPTEHVQLADKGYPWYEDYQPVSYKLQSRRGNAEQFRNMVSACNQAGVKVYVDTVLNHMSGSGSKGSGPGSGGTEYSKYNYPGTYQNSDFHDCRRNIEDYSDLNEVRTCELVGLADLKTESAKVRNTQIAYMNRLIDMGVSGFRLDGAKHMPPEDIAAITSGLHQTVTGQDPYIYQEVIADSTTKASMYTGNGDVTSFTYTDRVANAFANGSVAQLANLPDEMRLKSGKAVVFVANHDTERSSPTLTYKDGAAYDLANAFTMAYPYGTARVQSGFDFGSNTDAGPPSDANGFTKPAGCGDGSAWVCTHRHQTVAGMAGFARATQGTPMTNWWDNGSNMIAFGRGDAGFAVFNASGANSSTASTVQQQFQSSLPAGTYCNVMTGTLSDGTCTGETIKVASDGTFTATVEPNSGVALHTGAKLGN